MLQNVMERCNPFVQQFSSAYERYDSQHIGNLQVVITQARDLGRRYDSQAYPEIAAMVVENTVDGTIEPFSIVINDRTAGLQLVSSLHASYIPLHYVLMFPFSEYGWHPAMRCNTDQGEETNVTLREYCAYMLMDRQGDRQMYHSHFGRLFQQYIVDNYRILRSKPDADEIFFRYGWRAFSASGDFFLASGGPSFLATGRNNCWPPESIVFSLREKKLYANRLLGYLRTGFSYSQLEKKLLVMSLQLSTNGIRLSPWVMLTIVMEI